MPSKYLLSNRLKPVRMYLIAMTKRKVIRYSLYALPIIILIVASWFIIRQTGISASENFSTAQKKITNLIQQINLLASQSNAQFQIIEDEQKAGDIGDALKLVTDEKERNKEINETALALTKELENLTTNLTSVSNAADRQKIEEAVQYQISAISHLLNYGSGVDTVLEELTQKYQAMLNGQNFEIKRDMGQLIELMRKEIVSADENSKKFIDILSQTQ